MTPAQPSRYQVLRSLPDDYCRARWNAGKTVLKPLPRRADPPQPWSEPWVHTPGQIPCTPDRLCDIHKAELAHLIATSPSGDHYPVDTTIPDNTPTIAQEAARLGLNIHSIDYSPADADAATPADTVIPTIPTPYALRQIAWEQSARYSGPLKRIWLDGDRLESRGYQTWTPGGLAEIRRIYLAFMDATGLTIAQIRRNRTRLAAMKRDGVVVTVVTWTQQRPSRHYLDFDPDPTREAFRADDIDMATCHVVVDPDDDHPDPSKRRRLYYIRDARKPKGWDDMTPGDRERWLAAYIAEHARGTEYIPRFATTDNDQYASDWDLYWSPEALDAWEATHA